MENSIKDWEQIHRVLDTQKNRKVNPHLASDMFIAWPVVMRIINEGVMDRTSVLDIGCGTGRFCRHLHSEGMKVDGFDFSPAMIAAAAEHSSRHIRYHAGGLKDLEKVTGKYDVITALMVFPFIKDLEAYIPLFSRLLVERGTIIFAVYNPDFVESCTDGFRKVHRAGATAVASLAFGGGARIDAYVRDKDCYRKLFEKHGFEYVSAHYPPFTPAFVEKYDWTLPTDDAKYLIMSLRKKPTRVS